MDLEKSKESEDHNRTLAQLEKVIKERDKLANEIIQMRRLQIHISHQLADRYTANSEHSDQADSEYHASRAVSAKSTKSVKFSKDTKNPKVPDHLVRGTAASQARISAAKEKIKEKEKEEAYVKQLREKSSRRHSSSKAMDTDHNSIDQEMFNEDSVGDVSEEDSIKNISANASRSSISSNEYSQSFSSAISAAD